MSRGLSVSPTLLGLTHDMLEEEQREREEKLAREAGELWGLTRDASLIVAEAGEVNAPESAERPKGKYKVQFIDDSDPFGLETDISKKKAVAQMTHLAWVSVWMCSSVVRQLNCRSLSAKGDIFWTSLKVSNSLGLWNRIDHQAATTSR